VSEPTAPAPAGQAETPAPAPVVAAGYEWLWAYCDPDDPRPVCAQPWAATFNGDPWTFATDGKAILYIPGTHAEVNGGMGAIVGPFYGVPGARPVAYDLDTLKAWCACPPPVAKQVTCAHCKQTRTVYERPIEHGRLYGRLIDRRRLGTALERWDDGTVDVYLSKADDFILLRTPAWRLALMPCRDDGERVTCYPGKP